MESVQKYSLLMGISSFFLSNSDTLNANVDAVSYNIGMKIYSKGLTPYFPISKTQ